MKQRGYIQPNPATAELWRQLATAKAKRDFVEVGRLSAEIRTVTIRNGHNNDGLSDSSDSTDPVGVDGGKIGELHDA